jgi:DNA-binding LacI/PurR family transcriptional regulator
LGQLTKTQRRKPNRVTIKDVAQVAGVSVTTVSNVLNARTQAMTEETLHRIQNTIQELGYRPSSVARSMVTRRTATIGLIIAEIRTALFLQALNIIEPIARASDHNLLVCSAQNLDEEQQAVELLLEKQVEGIIFLSQSRYVEDDYLLDLPDSAPPIVLINRASPVERYDRIHWDNTAGIVTAMDYLAQVGHRFVAQLQGPVTRRSSSERLQGYKLGLEKNNLEYFEEYVQSANYEAEPDAWELATKKLLALSPRPTAILASNDTVGAVVMRTVQRAGLRIPDDISVIGNDNHPFCTYLNPTLTTVELPIVEAGRQAIEMLLERVSVQYKQSESRILPCPLIIRESSGAVC